MGKYFKLEEFSRSKTASTMGINNTPDYSQTKNIEALVDNILDPTREALARAIHINSGFRCALLNHAVGGSPTSQHTTGEAVDIELGGKSKAENRELFEWIFQNCEYDQLINEHDFSWVHVSYKRNGGNRMQILTLN